jgi:L-amino acid N-acyltransferase YncA
MNAVFRRAQNDDLPAIVSTYNSTIASRLVTADLEPVTVESKREWFRAHDERHPLWVIEAGGQYAGWMSFGVFYGRPAYDGAVEISLYIETAFRKQGLGSACLSYAESQARLLGIHTLLGFIFGHNTVSLRLFAEHGYIRWGLLPGVGNMDGILRDLVIVGKKVQ